MYISPYGDEPWEPTPPPRRRPKSLVHVALLNFENGGLEPDGTYNFAKLCRAFEHCIDRPDVIVLCEAKRWHESDNAGLRGAIAALSEQFGVPYDARLGWIDRGPYPPAVFYNTERLELLSWWAGPDAPDDKRNVALLRVIDTDIDFFAVAQHWNPRSGQLRLHEAETVNVYGRHRKPVWLAGDLNTTASGWFLPQTDWSRAPFRLRYGKAKQLPNGLWVPDTAALDHLTGYFHPDHGERLLVDAAGFFMVPELAFYSGTPAADAFRPTTNTHHDIGALVIDWMLVGQPHFYVEGSYRVHVPVGDPPSDHRLVTASLDFRPDQTVIDYWNHIFPVDRRGR